MNTSLVKAILRGHLGPARCIAYAPDDTLASVGNDGVLRFWNAETFAEERSFTGEGELECIAISPHGKYLAATGSQTTRLWSLSTTPHVIWEKKDVRAGVAFSPDSNVIGCSNGLKLKLLDAQSGEDLVCIPVEGTIPSLAFSPDGKTLVSANVDTGEITLWEIASGELTRTLKGHTVSYDGQECMLGVWSVAFSPDGRAIASGGRTSYGSDNAVKIWDATSGDEMRRLIGHDYDVFSVAFSPNGRMLASSSSDQTVKLWDPVDGNLLTSFDVMPEQDHGAYCVAFAPNGHDLAAACSDGLILVWDATRHPRR